ncbi:MAG: hypothetical protein ACRDQ5_16435 [Sciscionella sp.]
MGGRFGTLDRLGQTPVVLGEREQARAVWQQALELYQAQQRTDDAERVQHQRDTLNQPPDSTWRRHLSTATHAGHGRAAQTEVGPGGHQGGEEAWAAGGCHRAAHCAAVVARSREEEITNEFGDPTVACARAQTPLLFAGVALFVAGDSSRLAGDRARLRQDWVVDRGFLGSGYRCGADAAAVGLVIVTTAVAATV